MAGNRPSPVLLGVLVVGLAVVGVTYRHELFGPKGAAAGETAADIKIDNRLLALGSLPSLQAKGPEHVEDYQPGRNLFDFGQDPEVERQRREAMERQRREEERAAAEAKKRAAEEAKYVAEHGPRPVPPPPPPSPPPFGYSFIGYLRRGSGDFLAFLDRRGGPGGSPVAVQVGDTVDNRFVVKKIDIDAVVIGFTDPQFRDRSETVRLVPQAPGRGTR